MFSQGELETVLKEAVRESDIPGIAAEVVFDGRRIAAQVGVVQSGTDRPLSSNSQFQMSCLMKLCISIVVLQRAGRGDLDLETPVADILQELEKPDARGIRVRHLLSHCGGYRGVDTSDAKVNWSLDWQGFAQHFLSSAQMFPPGKVFSYEHTDSVLLAEILRRTAHCEPQDLIQEEVEGPLGIAIRYSHEGKENPAFVGRHVRGSDGAFRSISTPPFGKFWKYSLPAATMSLADIVSLGSALANIGDCGKLLPSTLRSINAPVIAIPLQIDTGEECEEWPEAFTSACGKYSNDLFGHNGSVVGQSCAVRYDPRRKFVVALGMNAWMPHLRDRIIRRVVHLADSFSQRAWSPPHRTPKKIVKLLGPFSEREVCGDYLGGFRTRIRVRQTESSLEIECGDTRSQPIRMVAKRIGGSSDDYQLGGATPGSIAFCPDPGGAQPMLRLGVYAYKKETA